jgi:hypothetical protein
MITKPLGRPITGNPEAERRRKYFADRYQRQKKCTCNRKAPRCEYCKKYSREFARASYTTAGRCERARRERKAQKEGTLKKRPESGARIEEMYRLMDRMAELDRLRKKA